MSDPILDKLEAIIHEAEEDYELGGGEDEYGGLTPGHPDFDVMREKLRALLAEVAIEYLDHGANADYITDGMVAEARQRFGVPSEGEKP